MLLEGSCHCGAVRFSLTSPHPYPYNRCYCSICRKTAGGGGFAINLSGLNNSLQVEGAEFITVYQAKQVDGTHSPMERRFCNRCGSALYCWDPRWPELIHPHASAIDTDLPRPPEHTHLMLAAKPDWVPLTPEPKDKCFDVYPDEGIADWHERLDLGD